MDIFISGSRPLPF